MQTITETPRDRHLEAHVTELAGRSVGMVNAEGKGHDAGLGAFADSRALPGGVRPRSREEWATEVAEEVADARNYLLWWVQSVWEGVQAGEPDACHEYERAMRALQGVLTTWRALTVA